MPAPRHVDLCQDRALLTAWREGQPAALERVFHMYLPLVVGIIRKRRRAVPGMGASAEDDVAQEVMVKLLGPSVRERYDGVRPFASLVVVVTRNAWTDHVRRHGKEVLLEDPEEEHQLAQWTSDQPLPDALAITQEEKEQARLLLESMTPEERRFAEARYQDGLSQRDAAVALGISRQNVRTLDRAIRARMDAFLQKLR